jgi:hypothetical protein
MFSSQDDQKPGLAQALMWSLTAASPLRRERFMAVREMFYCLLG